VDPPWPIFPPYALGEDWLDWGYPAMFVLVFLAALGFLFTMGFAS